MTRPRITIAEAGDTIGREHQTRLNKAVKAKLAELEAKNAEERQKSLAKLEAEIEYWKGASKDEIVAIETKLAEDLELHKQKIDADREELKGLATLTFLTEPRYRDLKSRWGQVFKADMGAEAFLEILKRLDLDPDVEGTVARGQDQQEQAEAQESHQAPARGREPEEEQQPARMDDPDACCRSFRPICARWCSSTAAALPRRI